MSKPITADSGSGFHNDSDERIEMLLSSSAEVDHEEGLELLCASKQLEIFKLLRKWSDFRHWRLSADDIADVWAETTMAIWLRSRNGLFEVTGALNGLIRTIAYRRAIDLLRKRVPGDELGIPLRDLSLITGPPLDAMCRHARDSYNRLLERRYWAGLSKAERLVIDHILDFVAELREYPSDQEIADSINDCVAGAKETDVTVKGTKQRAFEKLRKTRKYDE